MDFGPSTYYECPSCKKPMRKTNLISYTSRGGNSLYSDGSKTGRPPITPDFVKCPECKDTFFFKTAKQLKGKDYEDCNAETIDTPEFEDLVKALDKKIAKNWKEEKHIRFDLWRVRTSDRWYWSENPEFDEYLQWKENCVSLIPLIKKSLTSIKDKEEYNTHLLYIAELNRNIGNFDECLKILGELDESSKWLVKQFEWQCKLKNTFTFELIYESELELEKDKYAGCEEYYERGLKYRDQNNPKKALADFNKAEKKGFPEEWYLLDSFYHARGELYLNIFKEYDLALADFSKEIELTTDDINYSDRPYYYRSIIYKEKGEYDKALSDINNAIKYCYKLFNRPKYHAFRRDIYYAMGKDDSAMQDNFISELNALILKVDDKKLKLGEHPFFYETESDFDITQDKEGIITISIKDKSGKPEEPEILYSGKKNALFRRSHYQFILLENIPENLSKNLYDNSEVIISEQGSKGEYKVPVRKVFEELDSLETITAAGYPFLTSIRSRLYANKKKSIQKTFEKEELAVLACILVREEDYTQLERFIKEKISINENAPLWFKKYLPTPVYYAVAAHVIIKDPVKMIQWLIDKGADPNKTAEEITPLGHVCYADGNYNIMKALLDKGANPNIPVEINNSYMLPLAIITSVTECEKIPGIKKKEIKAIKANYTMEKLKDMEKQAELLRKYGAKDDPEIANAYYKEKRKKEKREKTMNLKENILLIYSDEDDSNIVKLIPDSAFTSQYKYTCIQIPDSVVRIGRCAFAHNSVLRKVDIGRNVSFIGKYAFAKTIWDEEKADITEVINRSAEPQIINTDHFKNSDLKNAVLYVPKDSVKFYKKAEGWKEFGKITEIKESEEEIIKRNSFKWNGAQFEPDLLYGMPLSLHIFIGNFKSAEELNSYADNSDYENSYYNNKYCGDGWDDRPNNKLICGFCNDHEIYGEDSANIIDDMEWQFYEKEKSILDILITLPADSTLVEQACKEKFPELKKVNSFIAVYGWEEQVFKKAKKKNTELYYIGNFDFAEQDDDGRYDAWS